MNQMVALLMAALLLPLPSPGRGAAPAQESRLIVVNGDIRLDETADFTFKSLNVFVQYRRDKARAWVPAGSFSPNEAGRFAVPVPADSHVSVEVTTSDPTVRRAAARAEELDFYTVEFNRRVAVLRQEFFVPDNAAGQLERTLELQRGAALSLCMPEGLKSGAVQFRRQSERDEDGINVWSFEDSPPAREAIIGGLPPGPWLVSVVDSNDAELLSRQVDLRRGQVSQVKCE